MNEVMDMGNTMLNVGQTMEVLVATIIVGLLISFFGLKLVRVLTTIVGFVLGAGIGLIISNILGWSGITVAIVTLGCAVVLAALSFFLYRMGVFLMVLVTVFGLATTIIFAGNNITNMMLIIFAAVALVVAILSAIFVEPLVIVVTAIWGAVDASLAIVAATGLEGNLLITSGIAVAISIVGMIIQFMMHSRKIGKKEKKQAAIIKEQDSVESEVEKARLVLDDFEEDDETDK